MDGKPVNDLRSQLLTIRDQVESLEQTLASLQERNSKTELDAVKAITELKKTHAGEVAALKDAHAIEVAALQKQITALKKVQAKSVAHGDLDETEVDILKVLSVGNSPLDAEAIARRLNISQTRAEYLTEKLVSEGYLLDLINIGLPKDYQLKQKAREYLVKHGLA